MRLGYVILIGLFSAWFTSLSIVLLPTMGFGTPEYPQPQPVFTYKLMLLIATASVVAGYSAYLGAKNLMGK